MTNFMDGLDQQATKILGDKAKLPKRRGDVDKALAEHQKASAEFLAARDTLEDKILAMKNTSTTFLNIMEDNEEVYTKSDFGLDERNKDDAKKIKAARAVYSGTIAPGIKSWQQSTKEIDELNKHCIEMGKYKSPKIGR